MNTVIDIVDKEVRETISHVESELNIEGAVVLVEGAPYCSESRCIRVSVHNLESFKRLLYSLARQGIATGALPLFVLRRCTSTSLAYYILNPVYDLIVEYAIELT